MVSIMGRLCGLCAMSALMEMLLPQEGTRTGVRTVCGLLMLHMTLSEGRQMLLRLLQAQGLDEMIRILIG